MSKIFLAAAAIAATTTMALVPNAWAGTSLGNGVNINGVNVNGINVNGINVNGINSGDGINLGNGASFEALASPALIAVELQR